jgi:hypothetical protein
MHVSVKWSFSQLHIWHKRWGGLLSCWNHMPLWKLRGTSTKKGGNVLSRKFLYWVSSRWFSMVQSGNHQWFQLRHLTLIPCWNEGHWVAWGFSSAHAHRLWKLFTPLLVNVASSVHNTAHKKSGPSAVLCRRHWQNWRWRLLAPDCNSNICTSYVWKG